jgi:hypothetical protein
MSRSCTTCQHLKRPEIDRRLAAGEPSAQVARDYELNASSLHRHRVNCLKLGSSNEIKRDAARGTAAVALLPSKETLSGSYFDLCNRIDQIVAQAEQQGSLSVAISGLNSLRHTLDSLSRLAGHDRPTSTQVNVAVQTNLQVDLTQITERLIQHFDHEPEIKARIAAALITMDQPASGPQQTTDVELSIAPQAPTALHQQAASPAANTQKTAPSHRQDQVTEQREDGHDHVRTTPDGVSN